MGNAMFTTGDIVTVSSSPKYPLPDSLVGYLSSDGEIKCLLGGNYIGEAIVEINDLLVQVPLRNLSRNLREVKTIYTLFFYKEGGASFTRERKDYPNDIELRDLLLKNPGYRIEIRKFFTL